jgi:hypothetical protein
MGEWRRMRLWEPLIKFYFTWNIPSGAKAPADFADFIGTTEVVP